MCRLLMEKNLPWQVDIFIDSNKQQSFFMGRPVFLPDEIFDWKQYYIIVAVERDGQIRDRLKGSGLMENRDFISYRRLLELPSILLRQTIFDMSCYDLECNTMLNHLEITEKGDTRYCCTTFVGCGTDNILDRTVDDFWHSKLHKIFCLSVENKTYSFCDKTMCPLFVAKEPGRCATERRVYKEIKKFPETLALGHDSSCNLFCETCRKERHYARGGELELVNRVTDKIMKDYLPNCKFLILAGNGEVFLSSAYRRIYESEECNPQYIRLLSNGILFTEINWERFSKGKTGKIMLTVSVDAATEETYRKIRRGGDFNVLKRNMEFAAKLRRKAVCAIFV